MSPSFSQCLDSRQSLLKEGYPRVCPSKDASQPVSQSASQPTEHLSKPWLFAVSKGDEILPSYIGIMMSHQKKGSL